MKATLPNSNVPNNSDKVSEHTLMKQIKALSQAFENLDTGAGVLQSDLYAEYAKVLKATGCPCTECMQKKPLPPDNL